MKKKIRDKFLKLREKKNFDLDKKNQSFFSDQITKICKNHNVKKIGFYYPINYEVNIVSIVSKIKIKNLKPFLPVVEKNNKMSFREWKTLEPFYVNRFGILEPNKKNKKTKPQLILTPLVAFDKNKNRLGYGTGFYDRFLNQVSKQKNIISIGIAFSFQEIRKIPSEKHDKKLDYILTEKKLIS